MNAASIGPVFSSAEYGMSDMGMSESESGVIIYEEALAALLQGPAVAGMWHNGLDKMRDAANELAQTKDAEYGSAVHEPDSEWADVFGVGGFIYTANYKARVDNEYHDTLIHVLGMADALIEQAGIGMDLGNGYSYDPRGKGSSIRGSDGRFASMDGVTRGARNRD